MNKDSLKEKFAQIKEMTFDTEETKETIIKLKKIIDMEYEKFDGEVSKEEIWKNYLDEYFKELDFRGDTNIIYSETLQHVAIDKLIKSEKNDRYTYNNVMKKARNREEKNNKEELYPYLDLNETMVSMVRKAIRGITNATEKKIMQTAPEEKENIDKNLEKKLIKNIQFFATFIEKNGYLDDYIANANNILEELKLSNIKFTKRNPIPDEEYDLDGNLIKDKEDIGVVDVFDTMFLEKMPIEDLILMNAAWETQYFQIKLNLQKALMTIDTLDLYEIMINGKKEDLEKLDDEKINAALKKDVALTYVFKEKQKILEKKNEDITLREEKEKNENEAIEETITPKLRRQYKKFLSKNDMNDNEDIMTALRNINPEYKNLYSIGDDISALQGIIIYLIANKALKPKKWGTIDASKIFEDFESHPLLTEIAIEHPGFRGPIVMEMPTQILEILKEKCPIKEVPEYKGYINPEYCKILLTIPATKYYKDEIRKNYKEDSSSELFASLAGKPVKKENKGECLEK